MSQKVNDEHVSISYCLPFHSLYNRSHAEASLSRQSIALVLITKQQCGTFTGQFKTAQASWGGRDVAGAEVESRRRED